MLEERVRGYNGFKIHGIWIDTEGYHYCLLAQLKKHYGIPREKTVVRIH